jgi:hypothetical protein
LEINVFVLCLSITLLYASNYRGITVLPVISNIIETIIKDRSQKLVLKTQNRAQRGFTTGSSPMNSAIIVEECYREAKDKTLISN